MSPRSAVRTCTLTGNMKAKRILHEKTDDFSAVGGGLRRGCILIWNRDRGRECQKRDKAIVEEVVEGLHVEGGRFGAERIQEHNAYMYTTMPQKQLARKLCPRKNKEIQRLAVVSI